MAVESPDCAGGDRLPSSGFGLGLPADGAQIRRDGWNRRGAASAPGLRVDLPGDDGCDRQGESGDDSGQAQARSHSVLMGPDDGLPVLLGLVHVISPRRIARSLPAPPWRLSRSVRTMMARQPGDADPANIGSTVTSFGLAMAPTVDEEA